MSDISNKAEEIAGRAKQAAGDLTGSDELQAEGTADQARAQVKQGVDAVADKAQQAADTIGEAASNGAEVVAEKVEDTAQQLSEARDKAADTAHQLHLDDSRVVIAVIAGLAVVVTLVLRRNRASKARANKGGSNKHPVARKVAAAGISHALTR